MKKLIAGLLLTLLMLGTVCVPATAEQSGVWEYTVSENGKATVTKYTGNSSSVEVPEVLDGHQVTCIGAYAFYENAFVADVTIPGSVETIGEGAFSYCPVLKKVTIRDGVTRIDMYVFAQCTALFQVTVPDSVKTIGEMAFGYYTPDNAQFLTVPGFKLCGNAGSAAELYANNSGLAFFAPDTCAHNTLICDDCGTALTKSELLAKAENLSTGSTLSDGSLAVIVGVAALAVGIVCGFLLGKKKKSASAGGTEKEGEE